MIGRVLKSRYELTALLSDGPIFSSYSARDRTGGGEASIRVLKPSFAAERPFLDALSAAVKKYQAVQSPGLETLYALEEDEGTRFIVGEMTRGASLADRIRKLAPFSIPVSVATAISICQSLEALHRVGLAHGDLTSNHVVITADGEARLQLAGIWEAYPGSASAGAAVLPNMAKYLAPEVSAGALPTPPSDVYAAGILLYELLTGRPPYIADTPLAMAMKHATTATPSVRTLNPSVPAVLDEIVKKAMHKDPDERYRTAGEMLSDLRVLQDALRFGRSLNWPLRGAAASATASPVQSPVAPRMSAIRADEADDAKAARPERDVPVWMMVTMAFLGAVVLSLLTVWMIFNLNKPRLVSVPNIVGLPAPEARSILDSLRLEMRVAGREADERVEADRVLQVSPGAGEKVREGGPVAVTLSAGSRFVQVPDLRNLTIDKAKSILGSLNLDFNPSVSTVRSTRVAEGLIVSQSPAPRARVQRQTRINVVVSSGAGDGDPAVVDPGNQEGYLYTLRVKLTDISRTTDVSIEMTDERGTRNIHQRNHEPDEEIEVNATGYGDTAVFRIYYDGVVRKTVTKHPDGTGEEQ